MQSYATDRPEPMVPGRPTPGRLMPWLLKAPPSTGRRASQGLALPCLESVCAGWSMPPTWHCRREATPVPRRKTGATRTRMDNQGDFCPTPGSAGSPVPRCRRATASRRGHNPHGRSSSRRGSPSPASSHDRDADDCPSKSAEPQHGLSRAEGDADGREGDPEEDAADNQAHEEVHDPPGQRCDHAPTSVCMARLVVMTPAHGASV